MELRRLRQVGVGTSTARSVSRARQPHEGARHHARPRTGRPVSSSRLWIEDRGLRPGRVSVGPAHRHTASASTGRGAAGSTGHPAVSGTAHASEDCKHRRSHGQNTSQEGVGSPHRPAAADGADAALHRPAPRARGDDAAGLRRAARSAAGRWRARTAPSRPSITSSRRSTGSGRFSTSSPRT